MEPCPMHSDCELYLSVEACEYRSGLITYEEAEDRACAIQGASVCTEWADNE